MSKQPIAIVAADTHLAPGAWKRPDLTGDAYHSFDQIANHVWKTHVPLILAGDILDKTRPDARTVDELKHSLKILSDTDDIPVYYIQGQHEKSAPVTWLDAIDPCNCTYHIHKKQYAIRGSGIEMYGLDWMPSDMAIEELNAIPKDVNLLIAHQGWRGLSGGNLNVYECALSDVSNASLVISGDYHKQLVLREPNKQGKMSMLFSPGSTCMQSINEEENKFFYELYEDLSLVPVPLKTRAVYRFAINNEEELCKLLESDTYFKAITPQDNVHQDIAKNIVYVAYDETIPSIYTRIHAYFDDRVHLFEKPLRPQKERIEINREQLRGMNHCDLIEFLELVTNKDTTLYSDAIALINSEDAIEAIETLKNRYIFSNRGDRDAADGLSTTATNKQ